MNDKNYEIELSNRRKLQIFPLGDIHFGNPTCNMDFLDKWKEVFNGTKSEKVIYLQGDLLDCAKKSQGNAAYEQNISLDEQIDFIIKFLKPLKKYIYGLVDSNHHARIRDEFNLDINSLIANALDIPYTTNVYDKFWINGNEFKVFATHGSKTSSKPHLMLGTMLRATEYVDADLVLYGHAHQCNSIRTFSKDYDGYKERLSVLTGSFLSYNLNGKSSYAERFGLAPVPCGFPVVNIGCDLSADVKYYIDK